MKFREYLEERKFDLGSGHMGNGISVWNRAKEVHGDYEKIAHIDSNRKIKYYISNPPKEVIKYVEDIANGDNPSISATQSQKVFKESNLQESLRSVEITYDDGTVMTTSMAAKLTDEDIKDYYKVGRQFNIGAGEKDKMVKVKSVKILK